MEEIDISTNIVDISNNIVDVSNNIMDISNNIIEHLVQNIFTDLLNEGQNTLFSIPPTTRTAYTEYINNNTAIFPDILSDNLSDNPSDNPSDISPDNPSIYSSFPLFHHIYQQHRENNRANNIVENSLYEKAAYKQVIADDVLEELIVKKFKETDQKNTGCPIYFTEFEEDDDVIELSCKHIFIPDGIKKWLTEESNECPVCRHPLKSKEIKNEQDEDEDEPPISTAHYHNPIQRYIIERILQSNNNNNNNNNNIDEDDIEFQQALINSMNTENSDSD